MSVCVRKAEKRSLGGERLERESEAQTFHRLSAVHWKCPKCQCQCACLDFPDTVRCTALPNGAETVVAGAAAAADAVVAFSPSSFE